MDDDNINSIPIYIIIILLSLEIRENALGNDNNLSTCILIIYKYAPIHADRMIQPAIYSVYIYNIGIPCDPGKSPKRSYFNVSL